MSKFDPSDSNVLNPNAVAWPHPKEKLVVTEHVKSKVTVSYGAALNDAYTPKKGRTVPSHRKGREKTEMCEYFVKGVACPFEKKKTGCNYAHGEHELKKNVLADHCKDLTDAQFFRSHPCFDFVATGAW